MWFKMVPEKPGTIGFDDGALDMTSWASRLAHSRTQGANREFVTLSDQRQRLIEIVREKGLLELEKPVQLASGDWSRFFVDGKHALASGPDLRLACEALINLAEKLGIEFNAVGGLTMGADQFAHGVALLTGCDWFVVRKAPKGRGTNKLIEGAQLRPETRVLLVDDVVTRGESIQQACAAIRGKTSARIVGAVTLVDRGADTARKYFASEGIPYEPLVTHDQLGIPAVGTEHFATAATG
jgi:orotate phosphoribosyltransferase